MATAETTAYMGEAVPRMEDAKLLRGAGTFTDNLTAAGMVWMAVVRSPFAHARIRSVDVSRARQAEGVVAAFAGSDLDWAGGLVCAWPVTEDTKIPDHLPLAKDKARYAGRRSRGRPRGVESTRQGCGSARRRRLRGPACGGRRRGGGP